MYNKVKTALYVLNLLKLIRRISFIDIQDAIINIVNGKKPASLATSNQRLCAKGIGSFLQPKGYVNIFLIDVIQRTSLSDVNPRSFISSYSARCSYASITSLLIIPYLKSNIIIIVTSAMLNRMKKMFFLYLYVMLMSVTSTNSTIAVLFIRCIFETNEAMHNAKKKYGINVFLSLYDINTPRPQMLSENISANDVALNEASLPDVSICLVIFANPLYPISFTTSLIAIIEKANNEIAINATTPFVVFLLTICFPKI